MQYESWNEFVNERLKSDVKSSMMDMILAGHDLLEKIFGCAAPGAKLLETGCGTAFLSIFMNKMGYKTTAIDIDENIVAMAKRHNANLGTDVTIELDDAKELRFGDDSFDVAFNVGTMEHFSDGEIIKILNESYRVAGKFIFLIPGPAAKYRERTGGYGDERLLPVKKWKELIGRTKWHVKEVFYAHRSFSILKSNPFKIIYFLNKKYYPKTCVAQGFVLVKGD